jgi:hypothetical protein
MTKSDLSIYVALQLQAAEHAERAGDRTTARALRRIVAHLLPGVA